MYLIRDIELVVKDFKIAADDLNKAGYKATAKDLLSLAAELEKIYIEMKNSYEKVEKILTDRSLVDLKNEILNALEHR